MESSVIITLIICVTIVLVSAIIAFAKTRDEVNGKMQAIRDCINVFKGTYVDYNSDKGQYDVNADDKEILNLLDTIYRIS